MITKYINLNEINKILKYNDFCLCEAKSMTQEEFIERVHELYGDEIDCSKVSYINNKSSVILKCNNCGYGENGEWTPFAKDVLAKGSKNGLTCCPKCSHRLSQVKGTSTFIKQAKEIHGEDRYNYDKVDYINARTRVIITCPEHGDFKQIPFVHLGNHGCPKCNSSKLEIEIHKNFPDLEQQSKFDWLKSTNKMSLDFYNNKLNIAIECQGEQHFTQIKGFKESVENIKRRDELKYNQCKEKGIEIIYYPKEFDKYNVEFYNDKKCFHTIEEIKKYLKSI